MTPLSFTHLRFLCRATTDVILNYHAAGNSLRNAWANIMLHATCPETPLVGRRPAVPPPEHAATCPACWFLAAELKPGSVARPYAFVPPRPPRERVRAGETLAFGLTLFGDAFRFLPYAVLAAAEMGRGGVGPGRREGLGHFELQEIRSRNPFTGEDHQLLAIGDPVVRIDAAPVTADHVADAAAHLVGHVNANGHMLHLRFISPIRLEEKNQLYRSPDFSVLFNRLLWRIDDLSAKYAGGTKRDPDELIRLREAAGRVHLVDAETHWVELWSWSSRKGDRTPVGGLVGTAAYRADDWTPLLPWLMLGQGTQVGKSTVKGNGVYEVIDLLPNYWDWMKI